MLRVLITAMALAALLAAPAVTRGAQDAAGAGGTVGPPCHGRFPNLFTDVCWRCVFPITIGPSRITMGMEDYGDTMPLVCSCPAPPPVWRRWGIGITFWEPARVAEVVRTPFCSPLLGGTTLGSLAAPAGTNRNDSPKREAFYHVHWYIYPLLSWMNLMTNTSCYTAEPFDIAYITELDPMWQDDELSFLINPEAVLFANNAAQAACAADCVAATAGFPLDPLFWCAGCQGSMYPLDGTVKHHVGGVDSSLVLVQRMAAKLHRMLVAMNTSNRAAMCMPMPAPILPKTQYKTQMIYPVPYPVGAQPFGRVTIPWAAGREFPVQGEDWGYLIWRRKACCAS